MKQKTRIAQKTACLTFAFAGALLAGEELAMAQDIRRPSVAQTSIPTYTPASSLTRIRGFVGVFDHGQDVEVGAGLSRRFGLGKDWSVDTSFSVMSDGRNVRLANAELDINTPGIGPVSFTGYVYSDALYNVGLGAGGTVNLGRSLHISAEWERPNWGGVFANYVLRLGSRVSITPQAIFLFSDSGAEGAGGWLRLDVDCGAGVNVRAQVNHVRSLRTGEPINENAMLSVSFGI